jgi:hypothetical protein
MDADAAIVERIIRRHGKVIDLEAQPEVIIDIIRQFAPELRDGGAPGGAPPQPPPGPTSLQGEPTLRDVMKEVLKVSRQLAEVSRKIGA